MSPHAVGGKIVATEISQANAYYWLTSFLQDAATWLDFTVMPEKTMLDKTADAVILSMLWSLGSVRVSIDDKGKCVVKTFDGKGDGLITFHDMSVLATMMTIANVATRRLSEENGVENVTRNDE